MNRTISQLSVIIVALVLFQFSCKQEEKKSQEKSETDSPTESIDLQKSINSQKTQVFTTKSGKIFELTEHSNEDGLNDFYIIPKGFEFRKDTLIVADADPYSGAFLADLDDNGFEEFYLVTTSAGSGSYGNIYGYSSNADKSVSPISMAPMSENDLAPGAMFEGYMGHDSIYLDQGKLMRKFPIYLDGDPNCCPTGGHSTIIYDLKAGEASWKLVASKQKVLN
jgi:hypothetical protein